MSVGYAPVLRITLPRNMRHFTECLVVTSPEDEETRAVVESVPGARLSITDAFTRYGARFNKGLSIEEAGFDVMGREGWIAIWDSDILLPPTLPLDFLRPEWLHGCKRRILSDPSQWRPDLDWGSCPPGRDGAAPIGFLQIFHADAPALHGKRPWYDVSFAHAGGCDAYFLLHWAAREKAMLPMEVLHLGRVDQNWFGVDQAGRDMMAKYATENKLARALENFDPGAADRAGDFVTRVEVPGYGPSNFELPFVRRAKGLL